MIQWLLFGLGVALALEGLVFALMPSRLENIARMIENMPHETRRALGLAALASGVLLIWIAKLV